MRYTIFGRRTGLRVSELALGTGSFGTGWGHGALPAEAKRMFDLYAEAGGNFIDTADVYQGGQSESILADLIAADRDHFVLASKYTLGGGAGPSRTGNSRKAMVASLEASLKRLGTERLDLYWVHMPDGLTPIDEILRAFDDLARAGKIHYAGFSDFPAWRVARAATLADMAGLLPVAGIQVEYSLAERSAERELLPMAEALGLGAALWSPLGGGFLTGKHRRGEAGRLEALKTLVHTESSAQKTALLDELLAVAAEIGREPGQVAISWVRGRAARSATSLIPILGANNAGQLGSNLAALDLVLDDAQMQRLDRVSAPELGFPHEIVARSGPAIVGQKLELLEPRRVPVA